MRSRAQAKPGQQRWASWAQGRDPRGQSQETSLEPVRE